MRILFVIIISLFHLTANADTDGEICINKNEISIEKNDIYLNSEGFNKHLIQFETSELNYIKENKFNSENCLETILLPFIKEARSLLLQQQSNYIITLLLDTHFQILTNNNGSLVFHHFTARIVKNNITSGKIVTSLLLAEGTRLEAID